MPLTPEPREAVDREMVCAALPLHRMKLRFVLHSDASPPVLKRWKKLRGALLDNDEALWRTLMAEWVGRCKLASNRKLPLLQRCECGVGGNDNRSNKQIRFAHFHPYSPSSEYDDTYSIIADQITNGRRTDGEVWTFDELVDLVGAFSGFASDWIQSGAQCVDGHIDVRCDPTDSDN